MSREDFIANYCQGDEEIYKALLILFDRDFDPVDYESLYDSRYMMEKK